MTEYTHGTERDQHSPSGDGSTKPDKSRLERARATATMLGRRGVAGALERTRIALARPTASDIATLVLTLLVCLVVGGSLIGARLAAVATAGGVVAALTAVLLASPNPAVRAVGGALAVPTSVMVAAPIVVAWAFAFGIAGFGPFAAVTVWALIFAALAGTLVSWDKLGDAGARKAATGATLAALGVIGVVVIRVLPEAGVREQARAAVVDIGALALEFVVEPSQSMAALSFFGLTIAVALALGFTSRYLPFERLVPPDRRDALSNAVAGVGRGCSLVIRGSIVLGLGAVFVPVVLESFEEIPLTPFELEAEVPAPLGSLLAGLLTSGTLRYLLLALLGVLVLAAFGEWVRRALRRGLAGVLARVCAPMAGGVVLALGLAYAVADPAIEATLESLIVQLEPQSLAELLLEFPTFGLVAALIIVALGMLASLLGTVSTLRTIRVLPPRAIGAALAAIGVFGLAISLAIIGRPETAIWTAGSAFVIWDIGEYADGIRAELGREAATMRAELVHAAGSVVTGALIALGTVGLYRWVATDVPLIDRRLAAAALATGLVTLALVALVLRK
ncbi:DUF7519 family protein [Natronosalvus amylolyticus]|uniref:DUF7519 family protein n=1 Tax=Natronosalvus amylolyticus TaxID=2961994 RepID=UPI0020C9DEFC|nr:hypothetical protein [Natronosalvus amylolyticus]